MCSRVAVVRVASIIRGTGNAEFQLGSKCRSQTHARCDVNGKSNVDRSVIERISAPVQRGVTGVRAIDEPGAAGADRGDSHCHVRLVPGGSGPGCGVGRFIRCCHGRSRGKQTAGHHQKKRSRRSRPRATDSVQCHFQTHDRSIASMVHIFHLSPRLIGVPILRDVSLFLRP